MQYLICFLEGVITFISPCLLPMLPVYITYFAGGGERSNAKTLINAIGFVLGFTSVFVLMGVMAGSFGSVLKSHQTFVNIVSGIVIVLFGLSYMGLFRIKFFNRRSNKMKLDNLGFVSSYVFGAVFSIGWTPCVGVFLGSALVLASQQGTAYAGLIMLLCY
jgi:cytochrome c-type biogenesis protein